MILDLDSVHYTVFIGQLWTTPEFFAYVLNNNVNNYYF